MTATEPFVVTPADRPAPLDLVGEDLTVLARGDRTGSYEAFLQDGREGSGPPPHHHPWDEAFYVVRGEVTFGAGDLEATVGPGSFVHIPGGTTHWFRMGAGGAEMLSVTAPGGAADFFTAISTKPGEQPKPLEALIAAAAAHGATIVLP